MSKISLVGLEEYESWEDSQIINEFMKVNRRLDLIPTEMANDEELQKALSLVEAHKAKYTYRKRKLKGLKKTLEIIIDQRGITGRGR